MAKKKKQKPDTDKADLRGQEARRVEKDREKAPEEPAAHDYGGLPARDLKKNLGCG